MSDIERFWKFVDRSGGPDACWPWRGGCGPSGHGRFRATDGRYVASRWLLGFLRGRPLAWPTELACHHCDNPPCCNPAHIYIGTHHDNARDAVTRGRWRNPLIEGHAAQTHCKRGHLFDEQNTYRIRPSRRLPNGGRECKACRRAKYWRNKLAHAGTVAE